MPPDFSCSLCSPYLLLLLLLQAGRVDGLKCYTGDSFSRVADVPVMTCNSSLESQCQFVCERMEFTNSTDGSLIVIDVCRYGCASAAQCQQYTSFNGGMFDVQRVCDCSWSTDDAFWTKVRSTRGGQRVNAGSTTSMAKDPSFAVRHATWACPTHHKDARALS
mmetsp:Transcript_48444/g.151924  ORF Transcript_48444/g.151924 Transcript_48444/m.151924 type:complete len:163 (-) Transcript_48444:1609-2097(-)